MTPIKAGTLAIIADSEHRILLVRTAGSHPKWQLPGGYLEPHESADEALARELREELGLNVVVKRLLGVYHKIFEDDLALVFAAVIASGTPMPDMVEVSEWGFFGSSELPQELSRRSRRVVLDCLQGIEMPKLWVFREP
jgi:8-oxo-dGTP diphosphatase